LKQHKLTRISQKKNARFNQPKTLSGIETHQRMLLMAVESGFNQPKTLSGIET